MLQVAKNLTTKLLATCLLLANAPSANAATTSGPFASGMSGSSAPTPVYTPPVVNNNPPPIKIFIPPFVPKIPMPIPPVNPRDIVSIPDAGADIKRTESPDVLAGLKVSPLSSFPSDDKLRGETDWILVRAKDGSKFHKLSPYAVELTEGSLLVSIRRPSQFGMVQTPAGRISFGADSDVLINVEDGLVRLINLSGRHETVKMALDPQLYAEFSQKVLSIQPGYELTIGDRRLNHQDLRPSDGFARRRFKLLENGHLAISEINVESVLSGSDLIASICAKESDNKERRVIADLSKMAAVLNYVQGSQGYNSEPKASLEVSSNLRSEQK